MKEISEAKRLRVIVTTFLRHGIKNGFNLNHPAQIRMAMEDLGPTFVKIGQILSTRPDILPEPLIEEFKKLHDSVKPENLEDIQRIIETEFGKPLESIFLSFSVVPAASASMAQVHTAVLNTGEMVVVKVLRPRARATMLSDISILRRLARLLKLTPQGNVVNPVEVIDELGHTLKNELDFLNEARNLKTFYENNKDVRCISSPRVYDEFTTSNILVMEQINGIKISDKEKLDSEGYILDDITVKLANNYLKQIFTDGFFHADPHPGNIFISGDSITYVDFGMMGTLSKSSVRKLFSLIRSIASRDTDAITQSILGIALKKGKMDFKRFHEDVERMFISYADLPFDEINLPQLMEEVFRVCRKNRLAMPRHITMLIKGLMTLEGVISQLSPEISLMEIAIPFVSSKRLSEINLKQDLLEQLDSLYEFSRHGLKLPMRFVELVNKASHGKLKLNLEHTNLEKSVIELNKMINRLVFGIIVAALIIGSSLIIRAVPGLYGVNISAIGLAGFIVATLLAFWLLISIMRSGRM